MPTTRGISAVRSWLAAGVVAMGGVCAMEMSAVGGTAQALVDDAQAFSFDTVVQYARDAAAGSFKIEHLDLAAPFANLGYDAFRAIGFRPEQRLWSGEGRSFEIELLPPGLLYEDRLTISVVSGGIATPLAFDSSLFYFVPEHFPYPDGAAPADAPRDLSYSGFRVLYPAVMS